MNHNTRVLASLVTAMVIMLVAGCGLHDTNTSESAPQPARTGTAATPLPRATFVKDASCRQCHEQEFDDWLGSDHERAMDHATEDTVLADFNNTTFEHFDETWRFFKEDGAFKIGYRVGEGEEKIYPVEYTFGVRPLQQYLVPFPSGRYQCVPVTWDAVKGEWYHLYPDEPMREGDPLHWTGRLQNWNYMCAECHSTNVQKGFDNKTNTFNTTYSDINVGCQACHGPGSAHVAWAEQPERTREIGRAHV